MRSTSFATFNIPVAPHVKKYLTSTFGEGYKVSQNDFLGMMITPLFTNEVKVNKNELVDRRKNTYYPISISYDLFQKQGCFLSPHQSKLIGRMLDKYVREMLFTHVLIYVKNHPNNHKQAILNFCTVFEINAEDIDPQTLYRDFYRKKKDGRGTFTLS